MILNKGAILGLIGVGLIVGLVVVSESIRQGWWNGRDDYRILQISSSNINLMAISPKRGLVNKMEIGPKNEIWIPRGPGWYGVDKISKLMRQEKLENQMKEVAFYNFGFWPDKVWWTEGASRMGSWSMWLGCGWLNGIRLKILSDRMLTREVDWVAGDRGQQMLVRDMADSAWLENETRFGVINYSNLNGLAEWLGERLTWSGLTVAGVESREDQIEGCQLVTSGKRDNKINNQLVKSLSQRLGDCQEVADETLLDNEVELRVGEKWAQMIQYLSNVRSF